MKIVHVITRLILGGAQENTILTCEGLTRRGHDVTLITGPPLGPEGQLLDRARAGGYRVIVLDVLRRPIHPRRDLAAYRALVGHLEALQPDLMHSHSSKAGILARWAAVRAGVPLIVHTVHGLPFHPYQRWWTHHLYVALERQAARRTDAILCVADSMIRQAVEAGVADASKFTTVYSGMETGRFVRRPPAADAFRASLRLGPDAVLVTQVARLAPLKGQAYLIEAARALDERVHVCLVGDGVLQEELVAMIRRARLEQRFHLTGLLPPDEIPAVMHASDIVAHCSLHEGLARTLPQALLTGTPVVSFEVDGAPEVVIPDETGYLVAAADVEGLVAAIGRLADDPALRERLGRQGRERAIKRFDAETMVQRIDEIYARLAGERVAR